MLIGTLVYVVTASDARADPVVLTERPEYVTEAVTVVDAPPAQVYALATDYARWPQVLSDVTSVKIEGGGSRDAKVRFRSKALGHEVAVVFDNVPDRALRFRSVDAPPGASAKGEYILQPIDGGRRTRIVASFYLHVGGIPGIFMSAAKVRSMRRVKLEHDLVDTARWFGAHRGNAA
jgi:hypothetical protein